MIGNGKRGLTRRTVLATGLAGGLGLAATARLPAFAKGRKMVRFAYVGCRTSRERNAEGEGIGVYAIEPTSDWRRVQLVGDLFNPSYLAFDRTGAFLYALHGDSTEVSAFRIDRQTGELALLGRAPTGGRNPVHLMPDPTNRFMVIANHVVSGEVKSGIASLPILPDGRLGDPVDIVAFEGKIGPHRVEQPFPKPHQVEFDPGGHFILVPDKGCDRIVAYRIDAQGKFVPVPGATVESREGAGPRHIAFHPTNRFAYVVNELDSTLLACRFDPETGVLHPVQILSAVSDSFTGNSRAAEVAVSPDGRFVYASNRGSDTVATYAVDAASGRLTAKAWTASGGKTPRFFALMPGHRALFVANEESHSVWRFTLGEDGVPQEGRQVAKTGSPTCILFA